MQGQWSSFKGLWTIDDDTHALLDSLMHGRRRRLRFKPPFDSHGADLLRWDELPVMATWVIRSKTCPCSQGYGLRHYAIPKQGYHTLVSLGPIAEALFPEG